MNQSTNSPRSAKKPAKHIVIDARNWRSSTGRYTFKLVSNLEKIDTTNRYTILVPAGDKWWPSNKNFTKLVADFPQFSLNPINEIKFARLLYGLKADLVHFSMTQHPLLFFPFRFKSLGLNTRMVATTHDLTMLRFARPGRFSKLFHMMRMAFYRLMFWLAHRKASTIIVPTNFVKDDLIKKYPFTSDKISVTYESADPANNKALKEITGIGESFIMHVGSPLPHKNIERLIEAFGLLKQKHRKLQLVLIGKKEFYFNKLEKTTKSNESIDDIHFTGFVSDEQLAWAYQNAKCYVLPSLSEGFGLPGLEAMVNGTPLASSNVTCMPEVYGDAAIYFNPNDANSIAKSVDKVLSDKKLANSLVKKGYSQVKKYSWQKMAQETLEVYSSVFAKDRSLK